MSAKEIKALIEVGTSLGYSGDELKQFLTGERMRLDKEREKQDKEKQQLQERQEKEKQMEQERLRTFELEKIRLENETKVKATNPNNTNNNSSRSAGMRALKLPPFNEDKDDLDAYLIRFERACTAFEVRQEHRSTQLVRLLQGKALDVYQRLANDEVDYYDVLKAQLLKRFRLTEGDIGNGSRQVSLNRVKRQHNLLSD